MMELVPIAYFRSPLPEKFGCPRQSGLAPGLEGRIVLEKPYDVQDALRGLEGFDYLWLIWGFSANHPAENWSPTVRPPRLGGNERLGVFATRSPYRPNPLGLSSVRVGGIADGEITVYGADLMDGTPIYDIKPYIPYTDSHPDAAAGFVDTHPWKPLNVIVPDGITLPPGAMDVLRQDPRPPYHDDPLRRYGLSFADCEIRFRVEGGTLFVESVCASR